MTNFAKNKETGKNQPNKNNKKHPITLYSK